MLASNTSCGLTVTLTKYIGSNDDEVNVFFEIKRLFNLA